MSWGFGSSSIQHQYISPYKSYTSPTLTEYQEALIERGRHEKGFLTGESLLSINDEYHQNTMKRYKNVTENLFFFPSPIWSSDTKKSWKKGGVLGHGLQSI